MPSPDTVESFQKPSAVFDEALLQGIQQDQLTGQGFLAVKVKPNMYISSPTADYNIKLLLHELQPKHVVLACLRPIGMHLSAGCSLTLEDGRKLQVSHCFFDFPCHGHTTCLSVAP